MEVAGAAAILLTAQAVAIIGPLVAAAIFIPLWRSGRRRAAVAMAIFSALAWLLGVWAFLVEPSTLTVRRVTIASPAWHGPPVRLGLISDTHVGAPHTDAARIGRVVATMNAERPDLVLLLGDYAGGHEPAAVRAAPKRFEVLRGVAAFAGLRAPLGVGGVLGNHDSWYDEAAIAAALRSAGVEVIENRAVLVRRGGGEFWLAGVADLDSRRLHSSVAQALDTVPAGAPVVLMTHWPDVFSDVPRRVALTVAGHTHCGQVNLPLLGRIVHASRASRRWACGAYREHGRALFVTGGVGVSILPVRFRAPPEIVLLTLRGGLG